MKHNHLHPAKRWLLAFSLTFFASAQAQLWTRDAILTAPVNWSVSNEGDLFGTLMVADDQTLAVSQDFSTVLIYQRDTTTAGGWALQQTLTLPPPAAQPLTTVNLADLWRCRGTPWQSVPLSN